MASKTRSSVREADLRERDPADLTRAAAETVESEYSDASVWPRDGDRFVEAFVRGAFKGDAPSKDTVEGIAAILRRSPLPEARALDAASWIRSTEWRLVGPPVQLWLSVAGAADEAIRATLESWALQGLGAPLLYGASGAEAKAWSALGASCAASAELEVPDQGFIVFARAGDTFHPALAGLFAGLPATAAGAFWNVALQEPGRETGHAVVARHPSMGPSASLAGFGLSGFAVNAARIGPALLAQAPATVAQLRASRTDDARWIGLEYVLSSTRAKPLEKAAAELGRPAYDQLAQVLESTGSDLRLLSTGADDLLITPERAPAPIGVILPITAETNLERVFSRLARQTLEVPLQISAAILGQTPGVVEAVRREAARRLPKAQIEATICPPETSLPEAFNLAASQLDCGSIVLLGPGVWLTHPLSLQALAAWAERDGVAAVTCTARPEGAPSARPEPQDRAGLRQGLASDRFFCTAISRRSWLLAGEFDAISFPTLWDVDWRLRAERLGLSCIHLSMLRVKIGATPLPQAGPIERALLAGVHPGRAPHEPGPDPVADQRASFLVSQLLSERRRALQSRQELMKEVGELRALLADMQRAVSVIGLKLDRT
jgi:hypothetical protein